MLGRSVEGVLFDRQGVVKDMGFPDQTHAHAAAIAQLWGNDRLLNTTEAEKAALIDGPVCVFYNPNLQNYYHWVVESLLALHVLAPHLPPGTRLVLPGTLADFRRNGAAGFDHASFLPALGFGQFATIEVAAPFVKLADAIWLESDSVFGMPAVMLQSFRARAAAMCPPPAAGPAAGPRRRRLYIKRGAARRVANTDMLEAFLKPHGFETLLLEKHAGAGADRRLHQRGMGDRAARRRHGQHGVLPGRHPHHGTVAGLRIPAVFLAVRRKTEPALRRAALRHAGWRLQWRFRGGYAPLRRPVRHAAGRAAMTARGGPGHDTSSGPAFVPPSAITAGA